MTSTAWLRELGRSVTEGIRVFASFPPELNPTARIIADFREAGAISPQNAQRFHPSSPAVEYTFARLVRRGVIRRARPGRYYLDERAVATAGQLWWTGELD